jgi:Lar family restriction alleviation protein
MGLTMEATTTNILPCPFCGRAPSIIDRPDNIDGTELVFILSCCCGGHSARAHQMARRKTPEQAKADTIEAWNTRAPMTAGEVPEGCTPTDAQILRTANHALAAEVHQLKDERMKLLGATHELLKQIDMGDFVDSIGHALKMNQTVINLKHLAGLFNTADGTPSWESILEEASMKLTDDEIEAAEAARGIQKRAMQPTGWVEVTQSLLNSQPNWIYRTIWIAMKDGRVLTGRYTWRQGRNPERFVTEGGWDEWALDASHVMPMAIPAHPRHQLEGSTL